MSYLIVECRTRLSRRCMPERHLDDVASFHQTLNSPAEGGYRTLELQVQAPHLALPLRSAFEASAAIAAALDSAGLPWRLRAPPPAGPLGQPTGGCWVESDKATRQAASAALPPVQLAGCQSALLTCVAPLRMVLQQPAPADMHAFHLELSVRQHVVAWPGRRRQHAVAGAAAAQRAAGRPRRSARGAASAQPAGRLAGKACHTHIHVMLKTMCSTCDLRSAFTRFQSNSAIT